MKLPRGVNGAIQHPKPAKPKKPRQGKRRIGVKKRKHEEMHDPPS
jgi:hypothetical protein